MRSNRRWFVLTTLVLSGVLAAQCGISLAAEQSPGAAALPNPFFAYCVGIGTSPADRSLPSQLKLAPMLAELGYGGMAHVELGGTLEMLAALEKNGQKLFAVYTSLNVDPGNSGYDPKLKEIIPKLKGHDTFVWLMLTSRHYKPSSTGGDARAVELLREIADMAKPYGVKVSLYPHKGCYAERMEDVVRLAKATDRPNVGVTFTYCHFLAVDDAKNMDRVLEMARPYLQMATINGTDGYDKDVSRWIKVLGEGSVDVGAVLKSLKKIDFQGPIGIIAYGVRGDHHDILARSMQAWKKLSAEAAAGK